jgi:peptide/nickel transport system substrate-binding protein
MPTFPMTRRAFTSASLTAATLPLLGHSAVAMDRDAISIAYPNDVPTWDPHLRLAQNAQSLYKMVFDSPLTQAPDLRVVPNLVRAWHYRDPLTLELELRDDALFHNGDKVTARDLRYTFFERPRASLIGGGPRLDTAFIWRRLDDIGIVSPQRAVMRFREPMPSAVTWLYFLASLIVPKDHVETVGAAEFARNPVGSGPYRLVEYEMNVRSVFEAFDRYWGGAPPIKRVTVEAVQDVFARVASLDSRRADLAVDLPIREITRLGATPGLVGRIDPVTDIVILELTRTGLFERQELRLAAHHAIDKQAISHALFDGHALPIDVAAAHGTPGYPEDFHFAYDPTKAAALVRQAGFGPDNPARIGFYATKGVFPNDFELAQAIAGMWRKVGIEANPEPVALAKYFELLHATKLPEAMLYSWGNTTGDPEMYGGYLFDPKSLFASYKDDDLGERVSRLLIETDTQKRYAGYRDLNIYAVETGAIIPLFQAVKTVAYQDRLRFTKYDNGWILPQTFSVNA